MIRCQNRYWVLTYYKERKPRDPTVRERFDTYRFADFKESVMTLLKKGQKIGIFTGWNTIGSVCVSQIPRYSGCVRENSDFSGDSVIDLLQRVVTVSVETTRIVGQMQEVER